MAEAIDNARADQFWKNADECRQLAGQSTSPDHKERWLKIADDWLRLADALEANDLTLVQDLGTPQTLNVRLGKAPQGLMAVSNRYLHVSHDQA